MIKKTGDRCRVVLVLAFLAGISVTGHSRITITQCDGRSAGLSNGFSASTDDIYALIYNPAGMSRLPFPELVSSVGLRHVGLQDDSRIEESFFAYALPFQYLVPWRRDKESGREQGLGIGWYQLMNGSAYKEDIWYCAYGLKLYPQLSAGFTLKQLKRSYGSNYYTMHSVDLMGDVTNTQDPLFNNGRSKSAYTGDIGLLYRFGDFTRYAASLVLKNITQPNISLGSDNDIVPLMSVIGFAYRFPRLNASLDWVRGKLLGKGYENRVVFAGEKYFQMPQKALVSARGLLGIGTNDYRSLGLGCSYAIKQVRFDYGFSFPLSGLEETMGTHQINVHFRFGVQDPEEYFSPELRRKRKLRRQAEKELERARQERGLAQKNRQHALQEIEILQRLLYEAEGEKAAQRADKAENTALKIYQEAYKTALEIYDTKKSQGLSVEKRITFLERTVYEFFAVGVDVAAAKKELEKTKRQLTDIEEQYQLTLMYYRKVVDRGASASERADILKKIVNKYRKYGIDVSEAEAEVKKLVQ